MANDNRVLLGGDLIAAIAQTLGLDESRIRHIVIDAEVLQPVRVYIEQFGDSRLLQVQWPTALKEAEITYSDKPAGSSQ